MFCFWKSGIKQKTISQRLYLLPKHSQRQGKLLLNSIIAIFLTAIIVPTFLPGHFLVKSTIQGVPKNLLESSAHKTPFLDTFT